MGASYAIHYHHIFPSSILYANGYDPDNLLHKKVVNEIANLAFLTAETNKTISNRRPEEYLPEVEAVPGCPVEAIHTDGAGSLEVGALSGVPRPRRELIARKINEYMQALVTEPEVAHERPIQELIGMGESATLQFKSTLQWDVVQNQVNKSLRKQVTKTVAAFLNSEGGTLVIGVEDDGKAYGLDRDLASTENSLDRFQALLMTLITDYVGAGLIHDQGALRAARGQ